MESFEMEEVAHENETVATPRAIAVAVKKGGNSTFAVEWALENLMSEGETLILLHVKQRPLTILTPTGIRVPILLVPEDLVVSYMQEMALQTNEMFSTYERLCNTRKVKSRLATVKSDDVASAIIEQILSYGITKLVIGSSSSSATKRTFKPHDVPAFVKKNAPNFCTVHIAPKCKLSSVHLTSSTEFKFSNIEDSSNHASGFSDMTDWSSPRTGGTESQSDVSIHAYPRPLSLPRNQSLSNIIQVTRSSGSIPASTISNVENRSASISMRTRSQNSCIGVIYDSGTSRSDFLSEISSTMSIEERESPGNTRLPRTPALSFGNHSFMEIDTFSASRNQFKLVTASIKTTSASNNEHLSQEQNIMMEEVEKLKLELERTRSMYAVAREEVKNAKITVNQLSVQRIHGVRKVEEAKVREEIARKIAAQEKAKSQTAKRQAETARQLAEREAQQRRHAELRAKKESEEKMKAQIALAYTHQGYKRYSIEEIQSATDFFSDSLKIGVGAYGAVYMGTLKHTKVAIKVLKNEANQGIHQFQRKIEILSQIRHPHMVTLLGACPEHGYLVYEYMENGSLEDRLLCKDNSAPLPWFSRFRIIWEVASALLFLHSAQPEPIVHGALKLENILLDYNFVSKIVDAGLARLVPANTTTIVTQYNDTTPADTFCYTDPECQRTSGLGPKSDLYALGIIILQLLTTKPPMTLTDVVETAIKDGSFRQILDKSAGNWPVGEARELAILGLKCADFQRRDGPDLFKDVLPELERFKAFANAQSRHIREEMDATAFANAQSRHIREEMDATPPKHFLCPIHLEVMDDPHIAADGFTYEYSSINTWLENKNTSPMTNQTLDNKFLIPNHALRSAILEWKIKSAFNHADYDTEQD